MLTIKTKTRDAFCVDSKWEVTTINLSTIVQCNNCKKDIDNFLKWNFQRNICNKCFFIKADTSAYRYSIWYSIKKSDKPKMVIVLYSTAFKQFVVSEK